MDFEEANNIVKNDIMHPISYDKIKVDEARKAFGLITLKVNSICDNCHKRVRCINYRFYKGNRSVIISNCNYFEKDPEGFNSHYYN